MEEMHGSERAKKPFAKKIRRALIGFFVLMITLTFLSRAASDALKARVSVGYLTSSSLDLSLSGTGKWASACTQFYTTYYTRRIAKLFVLAGQKVAAGDPLFAYDVSTVSRGKTASERKVVAAQEAFEEAKDNRTNAEDPELAQRVVESAEQALDYARFTYAQTSALHNGGVVCATFSGTILSCDLTPGKASDAGTTGLEVALGDPQFLFCVTAKEAERISVGDSVSLDRNGKREKQPLKVVSVSAPDAEGKVEVRCSDASGETRSIGAEQEWTLKKQSEQLNDCVPLEALRQGGANDYYVLVLTEKDSILGKQLTAKRVDVELLAHDASHAAVQGEIASEDRLITNCSKEIEDGDLVILNEK